MVSESKMHIITSKLDQNTIQELYQQIKDRSTDQKLNAIQMQLCVKLKWIELDQGWVRISFKRWINRSKVISKIGPTDQKWINRSEAE